MVQNQANRFLKVHFFQLKISQDPDLLTNIKILNNQRKAYKYYFQIESTVTTAFFRKARLKLYIFWLKYFKKGYEISIFKVLKWSQNLVKIILEYQKLEKSLNEKSLNIYVSEKYVTADQLYVYPSRKP